MTRPSAIPAASSDELVALADRILEVVPRTMRRIRARMRAVGVGELTVPQLRVLLFVRRQPGVGLSTIADHFGLSKAAASTLVDRLVRGGLLDRSDDPVERRRIRVRLTALGAEQVGLAHLEVRAWLIDELDRVPPASLEQLGAALTVLESIREPSETAS